MIHTTDTYLEAPPIGEITNISSEIQGFPEITYTSGDSVFYYEESLDSFYLVFNWAAQPGDSWRLFDLDGIQLSEECDSSAVIVDSIGTFNFSGQVLRWISLSGTGTGDLEIKGKIFEKFGAVGHYFLFNNADCSGSSHREFAHPLCYTHPSLGEFPGLYDVNDSYNETNGLFVPLTNTTSNCNAYVELSLPEVYSSIDLRIFPQPADEILTINFNNQINGKYKIYNLTGNLMLSDVFIGKNAQINVSQLPSGFYTIHISGDNFVKSLKILIK